MSDDIYLRTPGLIYDLNKLNTSLDGCQRKYQELCDINQMPWEPNARFAACREAIEAWPNSKQKLDECCECLCCVLCSIIIILSANSGQNVNMNHIGGDGKTHLHNAKKRIQETLYRDDWSWGAFKNHLCHGRINYHLTVNARFAIYTMPIET